MQLAAGQEEQAQNGEQTSALGPEWAAGLLEAAWMVGWASVRAYESFSGQGSTETTKTCKLNSRQNNAFTRQR